MRNFVDTQLAYYFNHFVHRNQVIDALVFQVAHNHLFKGAVLLSIMVYAWFKSDIVDGVLKKTSFLLVFGSSRDGRSNGANDCNVFSLSISPRLRPRAPLANAL